jgi:hypothetical protein
VFVPTHKVTEVQSKKVAENPGLSGFHGDSRNVPHAGPKYLWRIIEDAEISTVSDTGDF